MKSWLLPLALVVSLGVPVARADDPAMAAAVAAAAAREEARENYNKLKADVEQMAEARQLHDAAVRDQLQQITRELAELRGQLNKPRPIYATPEDVRRLAEKIQEVDQKRVADGERFSNELREALKKLLAVPPPKTVYITNPPPPPAPVPDKPATAVRPPDPDPVPAKNEVGFEYTVKSGDNFVKISKAYAAKGVKVTPEQIQKANPGVKSERLFIGKKLWIPAEGASSAGGAKE